MSLFRKAAKGAPKSVEEQTADEAMMLVGPLQPSTFVAPGTGPFQTAHLFGTWGGVRPWLEARGIHPWAYFLGEAAGNPSGGKQQTGAFAYQASIGVDLDWFQIARIPGLKTHFQAVNRNGSNLSSAMGNLFDVQEIWGGQGSALRLVYFTVEQSLARDRINIMAGRMLAGTDFAASDLYCGFQNLGLCPNPESLFLNARTSGGGYQIFPYSSWGGRMRVWPMRHVYAQAGAFEEDSAALIGTSGWDWGLSRATGALFTFELGLTPEIGPGKLPGHYKIGGMFDTARHPDFRYADRAAHGVAPDAPQRSRGITQIYALADQMVYRTGPGLTSGIVLLGGFVWSDRSTAMYDRFGFAGVSTSGLIPGRPSDKINFLALYGQVNSRIGGMQSAERARGIPPASGVQSNEVDMEVDYAATLLTGLTVMPNVQYIVRPGAVSTYPNALVIGTRVTSVF